MDVDDGGGDVLKTSGWLQNETLFTSFKINIDLDIITLSEVNQRQRPYDITYVWSLKKKKDTKEFIYKAEMDLLTKKTKLLLPKWGESMVNKLGVWD